VLDLLSPRRGTMARHRYLLDTDLEYSEAYRAAKSALSRGYADANPGPGTTPWRSISRSLSADAHTLEDLHRQREQARELGRDDPLGSGVIDSFVRHVIGVGIQDRAATEDPSASSRIDAAWSSVRDVVAPAECCGWLGVQRLLVYGMVRDGDIFVHRAQRGGRMVVEIVEGDRVGTPTDISARDLQDPEGQVRAGVERDRDGVVVAYWISRRHPGDQLISNQVRPLKPHHVPFVRSEFDRIPAEEIRHLKVVDRPGQSRGVTDLHAVSQDLRDMDCLIEAVLKRVHVGASFGAAIESPEPLDNLFDNEATADGYGTRIKQDLVPGMILRLFPGEKISLISPNFPMPDIEVLVRILARRIGAALGVSWQVVLHDFSQANFASQRMDRIEADVSYGVKRAQVVEVLAWIRRSVLEDMVLRGELQATPEQVALASWIPPAVPWVDPQKEAAAAQILLEAGLATKRDILAGLGKDWREVVRQQVEEERFEAELREEVDDGADISLKVIEGGASDEPVQDTALNGAQVVALISILKDVASGLLPIETAVEAVLVAFPGLDRETVEGMLAPVEGFVPVQEAA